ncbi:MAG: hypothetical protein ACREFW_00300 [Rhizomicrobium sp.]
MMDRLDEVQRLAGIARILILAGLTLAGALLGAGPVHADTVSTTPETGFVRLDFMLSPAAVFKARIEGLVLTLAFDRKVGLDPQRIVVLSAGAISSGHADADGKTLRFALNLPVKLHQSELGEHAVLDLAPAGFPGQMPDLVAPSKPLPKPLDVASLPEIALRTGIYQNFTRLVFDWPRSVNYNVQPGAGKLRIRFQALARLDLSAIARFSPPWVKNAAWHIDGNTTVAEFETDSDSGFHDFKDGTRIVVDVLSPKADTASYAPPGMGKPVATAIAPIISKAQEQAVIATANRLAGKKGPPAPPPAGKPGNRQPIAAALKAPPAPPAEAPAPTLQETASQIAKGRATVTFKGAGARPNAVFVRGLTVWVVLEKGPGFNSDRLKTQLGEFAASVEASSGDGVSLLRIGLKQKAQVIAIGSGQDLKVVIGPDVGASPITISFARNQDDPRRASLSTLAPGADESLLLADPSAGDMLTVVPALSGRAVPAEHDYAEFAALPTASGVVIEPFVDDLSVKVVNARLTITRPGGLQLTPPSMPMAETPAALAAEKISPDFLDFAGWQRLSGGSFLATERHFLQQVARTPPSQATRARLSLARFYLANRFAAEALGEIDLIQTDDPGLKGDAQLATMRAAADYMMGRYRDAHNDLASTAFDSDRHAAFWRGLDEAALENWKAAHIFLEEAGPVLKKYQPQWQAKAHLADAAAGLGLGRLELADAALNRLPRELGAHDALEEELDKGRIAAAENRYPLAAADFAAVENADGGKLAAQAIYYQTVAALGAHVITAARAIDILERLRFRWRGDGLEMQTLRKLASLYFQEHRWQAGLKTLRVAVQNFAGDDQARAAEDDMRVAFVNLYLKGGADKLPPIESLAIFYDNIDLTPIGADGDQMIRRMADRLVAVDLLGPAAKLLAYQVNKRLDGIAKAEVSTRLAAIYLMDHKPQAAVDALHGSQISGLPDPDNHARMILEARAFAALKQWNNALDLIAVDDQPDTRRLRADIYWESGNWDVAGQKIEGLLGDSWSDSEALGGNERSQVLRAAVSYSLADDADGLERLRQHFAAKMQASADAKTFAVLSQPIDMHGLAFRDAAAKIASVNTLEAFMKEFSKEGG